MWLLEKRLQLILSPELMDEYLEIFETVLGFKYELIAEWRKRFVEENRTTMVNLAKHFDQSRDPDDNLVLATAYAGQAESLLTNDRDLLDLPPGFRHTLPFEIVTPQQFFKLCAD